MTLEQVLLEAFTTLLASATAKPTVNAKTVLADLREQKRRAWAEEAEKFHERLRSRFDQYAAPKYIRYDPEPMPLRKPPAPKWFHSGDGKSKSRSIAKRG